MKALYLRVKRRCNLPTELHDSAALPYAHARSPPEKKLLLASLHFRLFFYRLFPIRKEIGKSMEEKR